MSQRIDESVIASKAIAWLSSTFALLALLLAAIGLYGVLAFAVSQRTQEIGVRLALGAETGQIVRMVSSQGLRITGIGLVIGLAGAIGVTRLLSSLLFDITPTDPVVFLSVSAVLTGVALLASLVPALRASRIHPATALRHE
ncbi:MAG: FtsX-like permease family protein [bacterium]|nr:FtsX-like permease family protein [bacterium]